VTDTQLPAARFETHRQHLMAVSTRLLGSPTEAEDAVQETWLRYHRAGSEGIDNLGAWLTTVVGRVSLDMLRSRRSRREDALDVAGEGITDEASPEHEAILTESVGQAMQTVLERLSPAERVAFVLHDVFGVSFDDIATIVDRTPAAARQLASRGRRRVQDASGDQRPAQATKQQRHVVEAFFRASRGGDFQALLAVLDPDVVLRADATALLMGSRSGWLTTDLHGANAVAEQFNGRAQAARLATIDGQFGAVWATGGAPRVAFLFTIEDDAVLAIDLVADPDRLAAMAIEPVEALPAPTARG
jgi:RNA polymerase sigma factor (sigma-70 family)